jgi:hypothetical protein
MRDARPFLMALLLAIPFACHDDRGPKSPTRGTAGSGETGPATPPPTNEPVLPDVPNAADNTISHDGQNSGTHSPMAFNDSRNLIKPSGIGQPIPPGAGGTIGAGGIAPSAGTGAISTGGSIVH